MGGGAKQNDPGVAARSSAAADAAAQSSARLSDLNRTEQEALFNQFFGKPGSDQSGKGSLSGFMDPASLTKAGEGLQGPYGEAWNNIQNKIGQNFQFARGSLRQGMANRGFTAGMPSGFGESQERELARNEADTRGDTYTSLLGEGYKDALSNFWNAHNIASGQAAGAREGALAGSKNAGETEAQLYGTAGQFHQEPSMMGAALQAGGTAGAGLLGNAGLFCPARGEKVSLSNGSRMAVEDLDAGHNLSQMGGKHFTLRKKPLGVPQQICEVVTAAGKRARVSVSHTFRTQDGGYIPAYKATGAMVETDIGPQLVKEVILKKDGVQMHDLVYVMEIEGNYTYLVDGIWSLA